MARPRRDPAHSATPCKKGPDGYWHAYVVMGVRPDGTSDRKHLRRKDPAELRKAVHALEVQRDTGAYRWTEDDPTLTVWVEHWLSAIVPMSARRKTIDTYTSQLTRHLLPSLGHMKLSNLRPEHFETLYVTLADHGRSPHTIRAVHRVTRSALNEAVRRRRLMHNPILVARPPRVESQEIDPLSPEECLKILGVTASTWNGPRWSLALALGLRQGEALGLLWEDVDLEAGTIKIRRASQRWVYRHGCGSCSGTPLCERKRGSDCPQRKDGGLRLVEPKTRASLRTIVLPDEATAELRRHRVSQAKARLAAGPAWVGQHDLVFATENGLIIDPGKDQLSWKAVLRAAGVRAVRVHDARHTAATLMLLQEIDIRTVMAVMGWTEMATAQRYTHAVDDLKRRAAKRMGSMLWPASPASG